MNKLSELIGFENRKFISADLYKVEKDTIIFPTATDIPKIKTPMPMNLCKINNPNLYLTITTSIAN